mmetsp:Transcript_29915/g.96537  ORF Transcript_29915/g.96537 Transcript_29915/m.96537 type:complete len:218 (-) Transcript_29915:1252-1905(-)
MMGRNHDTKAVVGGAKITKTSAMSARYVIHLAYSYWRGCLSSGNLEISQIGSHINGIRRIHLGRRAYWLVIFMTFSLSSLRSWTFFVSLSPSRARSEKRRVKTSSKAFSRIIERLTSCAYFFRRPFMVVWIKSIDASIWSPRTRNESSKRSRRKKAGGSATNALPTFTFISDTRDLISGSDRAAILTAGRPPWNANANDGKKKNSKVLKEIAILKIS